MLYLAQGIPFGFLSIALIAWIIEQGASMADVALIATANVLPWSFKWLWGPIVDRYQIPAYGRRRPWILFGQAMMVASLAVLLGVDNPASAITTIATIIFIHNIFSGLQDVGVDALAVDLLRPEERGRVNGLMYGSKYAGTAIGAAGLGWVLAAHGFAPAVFGMMTLVGVIMLVPLFVRERTGERLLPGLPHNTGVLVHDTSEIEEPSANASVLVLLVRLLRAFSSRHACVAAVLAFLVWIPNGLLYPIGMDLFINDLGWSQLQYTAVTGTWGLAAGLLGAVVGGFLADLIGARRLAAIAAITFAGLMALFALLPESLWFNRTFLATYMVVEQGVQGVLTVSLFAIFMSVSSKVVAATQFTAYMALLNLSYSIGASGSPFLESMGVRRVYLLAAAIQLVVVLLLPFCAVRWTPQRATSQEPIPRKPLDRRLALGEACGMLILIMCFTGIFLAPAPAAPAEHLQPVGLHNGELNGPANWGWFHPESRGGGPLPDSGSARAMTLSDTPFARSEFCDGQVLALEAGAAAVLGIDDSSGDSIPLRAGSTYEISWSQATLNDTEKPIVAVSVLDGQQKEIPGTRNAVVVKDAGPNGWERPSVRVTIPKGYDMQSGQLIAFQNLARSEQPKTTVALIDKVSLSRVTDDRLGFKPLFNGKDLEGWTGARGSYKVVDGAIALDTTAKSYGNLYTEKSFDNFVLRFEFKLTPGANNGIAVRAPLGGDAAYQGMEIQVLENRHPKYAGLKPWQFHGSVYGVAAARRGFHRPPGEWNTEEIRLNGRDIRVTVNGEVILETNLDEATKNGTLSGHEHPGLKRTSGHIGFCGHGDEVAFRNIRLKELSSQSTEN